MKFQNQFVRRVRRGRGKGTWYELFESIRFVVVMRALIYAILKVWRMFRTPPTALLKHRFIADGRRGGEREGMRRIYRGDVYIMRAIVDYDYSTIDVVLRKDYTVILYARKGSSDTVPMFREKPLGPGLQSSCAIHSTLSGETMGGNKHLLLLLSTRGDGVFCV